MTDIVKKAKVVIAERVGRVCLLAEKRGGMSGALSEIIYNNAKRDGKVIRNFSCFFAFSFLSELEAKWNDYIHVYLGHGWMC